MKPAIDVRSRGHAAWSIVEAGSIEVDYHNPWLRHAGAFGLVTLVSLLVWSVAGADAGPALVSLGVCQLLALGNLLSFRYGASRGPVRVQIDATGVTLGCGSERLTVPWTSVDGDRPSAPRPGEVSLPVGGLRGLRFERRDAERTTWWGEPVGGRKFRVSYSASRRVVEMRSSPPEFCESISSHLYPMLEVMRERCGADLLNPPGEQAEVTEAEVVAADS